MIQVNSLHYNHSISGRFTRSHALTPHDAVNIFCIIDGNSESSVSIIEDHILESISSTDWNPKEISQDFAYITEHYNNFIKSFNESDIVDLRVLLAMLEGDNLTLATIGGTHGLLLEKNGNLTDISVHENKYLEFQSISSGKISSGATVYLASNNVEQILGKDIIDEISRLEGSAWVETTTNLLEREVASNLHIIRLSRRTPDATFPVFSREKKKQSDILSDKGTLLIDYIRNKKMLEKTKSYIKKLPTLENKKYQYAFLSIGILILFVLLYTIISSLLGAFENSKSDNKNLLIQAKLLIEESQKLSTNPSAFNIKISSAEKILFDLRKEQVYTMDIQDLLGQIASMKKEVYDIQSIDMSRYTTMIPFDPATLIPLGAYEKDKKLTLIGEQGAIIDYVQGDKNMKQIKYPGTEKVRNFDIGEDGSIFLLTNDNRILVPRRDEFAYVNVTGQNSWEESASIKTFNGNIYLLNAQKNQVEKHKPGINGFSQKSSILGTPLPGVLDISIDGAIYLFMEDGKINRYTGNADKISSIILNKIPGEWSINPVIGATFVTRSNLSYSYVQNGNKIWIFQPNSKRFQDITSWEYKGQLELKTEETIKSIYIPRDGSIYVTTDRGLYDLKFEFVDGKIIFK